MVVLLEKINWFMPLPVQLADLVGHLMYGTLANLFPGGNVTLEPW